MGTDWVAWHEAAYGPGGPLRRRLEVVRRSVFDAATRSGPGEIRIVSVCAGDGRDVIGGLTGHRRAADAHVLLVDNDPELAATARRSALSAGLLHVEVLEADAGLTTAYESMVPADVVVVAGLFSHLSDADVRQTIDTLPLLCDRNAYRDLDLRPRRAGPDAAIRAWFVRPGSRTWRTPGSWRATRAWAWHAWPPRRRPTSRASACSGRSSTGLSRACRSAPRARCAPGRPDRHRGRARSLPSAPR